MNIIDSNNINRNGNNKLMILILDIKDVNINNIFFYKSVKNNILTNGYFTKVLYCDQCITMNGLYIKIDIKDLVVEKNYNKYKCIYPVYKNSWINKIKEIEQNIIDKFYLSNKVPQYSIYDQLIKGQFLLYNIKDSSSILLRISGIWEDNDNYGLTYKMFSL